MRKINKLIALIQNSESETDNENLQISDLVSITENMAAIIFGADKNENGTNVNCTNNTCSNNGCQDGKNTNCTNESCGQYVENTGCTNNFCTTSNPGC